VGVAEGTGGPIREAHLLDYWSVIVHRRWVVYVTTAVIGTCATIATFMQRPVYRATVQLQIEQSTSKVLPFQDVVSAVHETGRDFYQTQHRIIQSRNIARRVIESLDLAHTPQFLGGAVPPAAQNGSAGSAAPDDAWVVDLFLGRLSVTPVGYSRLVSVSFDSADADLAARVANAVADAYIRFTLDTTFMTTESASHSMGEQIKDLQEDIEKSMRALQEYAREKKLLFLGDQQNSAEQDLSYLRAEHGRAQAERIAREAMYRSLQQAEPASIPDVAANPLIQELRSALANLEKESAERSEKFKPDWPAMLDLKARVDAARSQLDGQVVQIAERLIGSAAVVYHQAEQKEAGLKAALDRMTAQVQQLSLAEITYYSMKADLESKKKNLGAILEREGQTGISAKLSDKATSNIKIVDRAEVPRAPFKPRRKLSIAFGILCGLALGTTLAFFFEYMDNTLKTPEDVEKHLRLATLAVIPSMSGVAPPRYGGKRSPPPTGPPPPLDLVTHLAPKSQLAEAYRELRTSILLSSPDAPPGIIMITSCRSSEGKTSTSINLAISLTQIGHSVLLVDADLRKPRIHKALGVPNTRGLSNFLSGQGEVLEMAVKTSIPGLWVIPSGPISPNPSELLESGRLLDLCGMIKSPAGLDHIIFDSPPLLHCADPSILSTKVDAVILIVWGGKTGRDLAQRGREKLAQARAHLIGAVLNNVSLEDRKYYYYYHKYYDAGPREVEEAPQQASGAGLKRLK
jgi:capsular exopolysaccharide synthesis family protein